MKRKRKTYTPEFKDEAVRRVKAGKSIVSVAKSIGISPPMLGRWVKSSMGEYHVSRPEHREENREVVGLVRILKETVRQLEEAVSK